MCVSQSDYVLPSNMHEPWWSGAWYKIIKFELRFLLLYIAILILIYYRVRIRIDVSNRVGASYYYK